MLTITRMELYPKGSDNRYIIVDEQGQGTYLKLECVWFCSREDLGDQIFCDAVGEQIWMCNYHTRHYVREEVNIVG